MEDVMRFEKDFATGDVVGKPAGRLYFPHGVVRFVILPDGLRAVVPREVVEKDFILLDGSDLPFGNLPPVPGDEDTQRKS
jgi:hypothetical protein